MSELPGARDLTDAARAIWLAGVGAASEVGAGGRALFDELVARGRRMETRQFKALDRAVARAGDGAERLGHDLKRRIDARVEDVLHRAGLPSRGDLRELSSRLDRLAERLEGLDAGRS